MCIPSGEFSSNWLSCFYHNTLSIAQNSAGAIGFVKPGLCDKLAVPLKGLTDQWFEIILYFCEPLKSDLFRNEKNTFFNLHPSPGTDI